MSDRPPNTTRPNPNAQSERLPDNAPRPDLTNMPFQGEGAGNQQTLLVLVAGIVGVCALLACVTLLFLGNTVDTIFNADDDEGNGDSSEIALDPNAGRADNTVTASDNDASNALPTPLPGAGATRDPASIATPAGDLVFVSNRSAQWEIWVMGADGSAPTQLTRNSPDINYSPAWSPDGSQIVFEARRNGNWDIYVMDANGQNIRNLTNTAATDRVPAWSPDGQTIAFASDRQGDNDIFVVNADGAGLRQLTFNTASDYYPNFSPDGSEIVYQSNRDGGLNIYRQRVDTTDADAIALTVGSINKGAPSWSPDGRTIAYYTNVGEGFGQDVYTVPAGGGTPTIVAAASYNEVAPTWSPDGRFLYYHAGTRGGTNILRVNLDTGGVEEITQRSDRNWAPDLKRAVLQGAVSLPPVSAPPTAAPSNARSAVATTFCPNTAPGFLEVGTRAVVPSGRSVAVYRSPTFAAPVIGQLTPNMELAVLNGPRCAENATWWYIQYGITTVWATETQGDTYLLEPITTDIGRLNAPTNRAQPPDGVRVLSGGIGLSDGRNMPAGEFQVEWYCNILGYGVSTDGEQWLCTVNGVTLARLGVEDLDRICQATYRTLDAFAVQDGSGALPAYRWRCYG